MSKSAWGAVMDPPDCREMMPQSNIDQTFSFQLRIDEPSRSSRGVRVSIQSLDEQPLGP